MFCKDSEYPSAKYLIEVLMNNAWNFSFINVLESVHCDLLELWIKTMNVSSLQSQTVFTMCLRNYKTTQSYWTGNNLNRCCRNCQILNILITFYSLCATAKIKFGQYFSLKCRTRLQLWNFLEFFLLFKNW